MNNYIFINTFLCIYFYLKQWKFFFINLNQTKRKEGTKFKGKQWVKGSVWSNILNPLRV